MMPEAITY
ncbi:Protein of unknown function [Propionibacterium freudenreichii]|nr:Protein of unknown function [Propionibacterium freudenreichii]